MDKIQEAIDEMYKGLNALRLEVASLVVDDLVKRFEATLQGFKARDKLSPVIPISTDKIIELFKRHSNAYAIDVEHGVHGQRINDYKWTALANDIIEELKLSPVSEHTGEDAYEPYFGWCDVEGCENEGCRGGGVWPDTGYWTVCYKHSDAWRKGESKPQMKQTAINREKSRKADRTLPPNTKLTSRT